MEKLKIQEALEEFDYFSQFSESVRKYSEWLLGISIALSASLLTIENFVFILHIPVLILSFCLIGGAGYIKYKIHLREMTMNIYSSQLRQKQILNELDDYKYFDKYKSDFNDLMTKYRDTDNEIISIAQKTNKLTYCTFIMLIITAFTISFELIYFH